jgi:hypothetical protein
MFAIIKTRWQTRARSRRAKRRRAAAPGSLRKKYAGIVPPLEAVAMLPHLPHIAISGSRYKADSRGPGEENLDIVEALRRSTIKLVVTRHEQAAAFMAATQGRLGKGAVAGGSGLYMGTAALLEQDYRRTSAGKPLSADAATHRA